MTSAELVPGHRYAYRGGNRMGAVYAQPDGTLSLKHGGITVDWVTRNRARLDFVHATADCHGCALDRAHDNVVPINGPTGVS